MPAAFYLEGVEGVVSCIKLNALKILYNALPFESAMFPCKEYPSVPSENNQAERTMRPRVIARKSRGAARSAAGSQTRAVLARWFVTGQ